MEKSLSRDLVHSTILTSLQKLRVPDCSTSGSVTLNFWSMLRALNVLHTHMEGEGGKTHLRSAPRHTLKTGGQKNGFTPYPHLCWLQPGTQTPPLGVKSSSHPHSKLGCIPGTTDLNHCLSSWDLTQSLVHIRSTTDINWINEEKWIHAGIFEDPCSEWN